MSCLWMLSVERLTLAAASEQQLASLEAAPIVLLRRPLAQRIFHCQVQELEERR